MPTPSAQEPLTADVVRAEPAGVRLNTWVAERVMGQTWQGGNPIPNYDGHWPWPPPYSTEIAAAMQLADFLRQRFWLELALPGGKRSEGDQYEASLYTDFWEQDQPDVVAVADTLPLAACRAALLTTLEPRP